MNRRLLFARCLTILVGGAVAMSSPGCLAPKYRDYQLTLSSGEGAFVAKTWPTVEATPRHYTSPLPRDREAWSEVVACGASCGRGGASRVIPVGEPVLVFGVDWRSIEEVGPGHPLVFDPAAVVDSATREYDVTFQTIHQNTIAGIDNSITFESTYRMRDVTLTVRPMAVATDFANVRELTATRYGNWFVRSSSMLIGGSALCFGAALGLAHAQAGEAPTGSRLHLLLGSAAIAVPFYALYLHEKPRTVTLYEAPDDGRR